MRDVGLRSGTHGEIWDYAKANDFAIVSKDADFRERSFVEGFPPKVSGWTWGTQAPDRSWPLLKVQRVRAEHFCASTDTSVLTLSLGTSAV